MDILPPTTFQGGKQRLAEKILQIISDRNDIKGKTLYDFCCGSGAVTLRAIGHGAEFSKFFMMDLSVWGEFWSSITNDLFSISDFEKYIKDVPDKDGIQKHLERMSKESPYLGKGLSHIYKFILLQAGSFGGKHIWIDGGKWQNTSFRSLWMPTATSSRRSHVNPMMPMPDEILRRVRVICDSFKSKSVVAKCGRVQDFTEFQENSIVYIDPPYSETTGYGFDFDITEWVSEVKSKSDVKIYVSEKKALGNQAFLLSEKRTKGNISGSANSGIEEWLTEF